MDSLSLLHWIFPTQELNWGLLHCRWVLYQLSYQGSPLGISKASSNLAESFVSWGHMADRSQNSEDEDRNGGMEIIWVLMEKRITMIVSKAGEEGRFGFRFQITSMLLAVGGWERSGEGREEKEVLIEQGPGRWDGLEKALRRSQSWPVFLEKGQRKKSVAEGEGITGLHDSRPQSFLSKIEAPVAFAEWRSENGLEELKKTADWGKV